MNNVNGAPLSDWNPIGLSDAEMLAAFICLSFIAGRIVIFLKPKKRNESE